MPAAAYNCRRCHTKLGKGQHKLTCLRCSAIYHRICLPKIPPKDYKEARLSWICDDCKDAPTNGDPSLFKELPFNELSNTDDCDDCEVATTHHTEIRITPFKLQRGTALGHLNVNGIKSKIHEVKTFLLENNFSVLAITESKLNECDDSCGFEIEGYVMLRYDRMFRDGGGTLIYVRDDIRFLPLVYDVRFPKDVEINCVQIFLPFQKPLIIVPIYNPPSKTHHYQFIQSLSSLLSLISHDKIDFMIMGDLNIDLLQLNSNVSALLSITKSFNLDQLIAQPTRVTSKSKTLLDPIFVSFPDKIRQAGCFPLTNSDHCFVFCVYGKITSRVPSKMI